MADLRTLVEREMDRAGSPTFTLDGLAELRDARRRNRRVAAAVLGLTFVLAIAVAIGAVTVTRSAPPPTVGGDTPSPTPTVANGDIALSIGGGIQIIDPADLRGEPTVLARGEFTDRGLAWSPDGSRLAYAASLHDVAGPESGIWMVDPATDRSEQIVACLEVPCPRVLDWSPDGEQLAVGQGGELYLMTLDGQRMTTVASFEGDEMGQPTWSPDGERIAFSTRGHDASRIYIVDADGSDLTLILDRPFNGALDPAWSPDGRQIAYWDWGGLGDSPDRPKIWVMDADGSNPKTLYVDTTSGDVGPGAGFGGVTWSPDGTKIAFVLHWEFRVMNADGTNVHRGRERHTYRPAWQPIPLTPGSPSP